MLQHQVCFFLISCRYTSHYVTEFTSQITVTFSYFSELFTLKYLTAQFHESAPGLRSCWLRHLNWSVFHKPRQGAWHRSSMQSPVCRMLEVSSHFKTPLAGGFDLWPPGAFSFFVKPHIWSIPDAQSDERALPWLSNEQIRSLWCMLVCQNQISSWFHEISPIAPWAN